MQYEIIQSGVRGTTEKETLLIQAWGSNAIRVRASKRSGLKNTVDALEMAETTAIVDEQEEYISIKNGALTCRAYPTGHLEFYKGEQCILKEYSRDDTQKNGHRLQHRSPRPLERQCR